MKQAIFTVALFFFFADTCRGQLMQYLQTEDGSLRCVSASGFPLVHTTQLTADAELLGSADLSNQFQSALSNIDRALLQFGSSLDDTVKLNVYVHPEQSAEAVHTVIDQRFGNQRPAVAVVHTVLPDSSCLVAVDAIGAVRQNGSNDDPEVTSKSAWQLGSLAAVCPLGPRVYISGQAERGAATLADATAETLRSLERTLQFLRLEKSQVLQVKCFLSPISDVSETVKALEEFFGADQIPPCSLVQWQSSLPIEIEMIASANEQTGERTDAALEVLTPPGMTTPTIYCRLMVVRHPTTIYTDGLYPSDQTAGAEAQLRSLFGNLKRLLDLSGSDWTHLVKATYYVSDDELSDWHNRVRPDYFSPRRPPAASKAAVAGVGRQGHGIMMDFIVVPGE